MKKIFLFIIIFSSISFAQSIIDSYSESNYNTQLNLYSGGVIRIGQSFTGNGKAIISAKFYCSKSGEPSGSVYAKIFEHSGTYGSSSIAMGAELVTSNPITASSISTSFELVTFTFSTPYMLTNGTKYVILVEYDNSDSNNRIMVGYDDSSPTHSGNLCVYFTTWSAISTSDLIFYTYSESVATTFIPIITFIE
jgi:hypothetical protein